jgi:hypothetical protein
MNRGSTQLTQAVQSRHVAASGLRRPPQLCVVIEESDLDHHVWVVPAHAKRQTSLNSLYHGLSLCLLMHIALIIGKSIQRFGQILTMSSDHIHHARSILWETDS